MLTTAALCQQLKACRLLFFRLLCRFGFVRRFVGVLSRLFLQVGFEFLAVDFAVLVGVDFVEMVGEGSALQLFASQSSVGVLVEVVELRAALWQYGRWPTRSAIAALVGHEPSGRAA